MGNILLLESANQSDAYALVVDRVWKSLQDHTITRQQSGNGPDGYSSLENEALYNADLVIAFIDNKNLHDAQMQADVDSIINFSAAISAPFIPILTEKLDLAELINIWPSLTKFRMLSIDELSPDGFSTLLQRLKVMVDSSISKITTAEIKENIESNAPKFIEEAESRLQNRAKELRDKAQNYFIGSYFIIIVSLIIAGFYFWGSYDELTKIKDKWLIIILFARSLVMLTLVTAVVKYSFTLGRAYMHEALKLEERIHAISFGKFYLNVYKQGVTPTELKEVFRDWNINQGTTAFLEQKTSDFDPKVFEQVLDIVKAAKNVVGKD